MVAIVSRRLGTPRKIRYAPNGGSSCWFPACRWLKLLQPQQPLPLPSKVDLGRPPHNQPISQQQAVLDRARIVISLRISATASARELERQLGISHGDEKQLRR